MTTKQQHSDQWLDGAIRQVELLCKQAAEYPEEYTVPTDQTRKSAIAIMSDS